MIASLAVVMAKAGKKVLLIDCDFRNPTQHKLFGLPNKGVSNCIATGGDFHEILQQIGQENLDSNQWSRGAQSQRNFDERQNASFVRYSPGRI